MFIFSKTTKPSKQTYHQQHQNFVNRHHWRWLPSISPQLTRVHCAHREKQENHQHRTKQKTMTMITTYASCLTSGKAAADADASVDDGATAARYSSTSMSPSSTKCCNTHRFNVVLHTLNNNVLLRENHSFWHRLCPTSCRHLRYVLFHLFKFKNNNSI